MVRKCENILQIIILCFTDFYSVILKKLLNKFTYELKKPPKSIDFGG